MKIILTGGTGLIGDEALRAAVDDPRITSIIALSRTQPVVSHSKLRWVRHDDFSHYEGLEEEFETSDAIIWALGISQTQVKRDEYVRITFDFTAACAAFCVKHNPRIRFVFVSGDGADNTESSRTLFRKIKGRAENFLRSSALENVLIARPGAVRPRRINPKSPLLYKILYPVFPLMQWLTPSKVIWSDGLGRALVKLAVDGSNEQTIENPGLLLLGKNKPR